MFLQRFMCVKRLSKRSLILIVVKLFLLKARCLAEKNIIDMFKVLVDFASTVIIEMVVYVDMKFLLLRHLENF